jgi:tRNA threonylcarbamoyladenosine biosynthesis protein TsaB
MSLILGIDTSSTDLGIGLSDGTKRCAAFSRFVGNSHAETIADAVSLTLASCGRSPREVTHLAISCGPGSFTGLRIGIAFAKGFCLGTAVGVLPLSSLYILAHGGLKSGGSIVAAIDARRDEVFWARFRPTPEGIVRLTDDCRSGAAEFREALHDDDTIVTDTMGYAKSSVFVFLGDRAQVFPVERYPLQRGLHCAEAGALALACGRADTALWQDPSAVLPRYHRDFAPPAGYAR